MVHNLPFFTYKALFSTIQTNLLACPSAISGQNLELCSLPANFQAGSTYIFPGSQSEIPVVAICLILMILPHVCRGSQGPQVHHFMSETFFFIYVNVILMSHLGE